jgi:hypothetical protein
MSRYVVLDSGGVVMLDLVRIPQGEIRQIAQNDYPPIFGFAGQPPPRQMIWPSDQARY